MVHVTFPVAAGTDKTYRIARVGSRYLDQRSRIPQCVCLLSVLFALVVVCPATAETIYMAGNPALSAHIAGTNEFSPGDDISLQVVIGNAGLNQFEIVQSGITDPGDLSSTAKQLTVMLSSSDAPLMIKSGTQTAGDLPTGTSTATSFQIKVDKDAPAGTYQVPVVLNYRYLYQQTQDGPTLLTYQYKNVSETLLMPMVIQPRLQIAIAGVKTENLTAGNEGYVIFSVQNTGYEDGHNAVILLQRDNQSPLTPREGSTYIGDFPRGAVAECRFRVMADSLAQQQTYPLEVRVTYRNAQGAYVDSGTETIGVPVGRKVSFNATPVRTSLAAGAKSILGILYQNTGSATAYNVRISLTAVDPLTSNDNMAFLGTMVPGDSREADFDISVAAGAPAKAYGIDSAITYRDSLDNQVLADPVTVNVQVVKGPDILVFAGLSVIIILIVAGLAAAVVRIFRHYQAR